MIERQGPLSLSRQCELLGLSRAALYYRAVRTGAYELELMALHRSPVPAALPSTVRGGWQRGFRRRAMR